MYAWDLDMRGKSELSEKTRMSKVSEDAKKSKKTE